MLTFFFFFFFFFFFLQVLEAYSCTGVWGGDAEASFLKSKLN